MMRPRRSYSNSHPGRGSTQDNSALIRARVEQALGELPLGKQDRAEIAERLLKESLVLRPGSRLDLDSAYFDFRAKVAAVVEHFAPHGLTPEDYLRAIVERPALLSANPVTLIVNIETVAGHFAAHGLTLPDYLRAAVRRPSLFAHAPATIQSNIETVAKHFAAHGLELAEYLRAAANHPSLFYQKPATLIGNIEAVASHFAPDGLTLPDYLRAALRHPRFFTQAPATLIGNIEAVAEHFAPHGLALDAYLRAALRLPQLFAQSPVTVRSNIETVAAHFAAQGLSLGAYLAAALRLPPLFARAPASIIRHIGWIIEMQAQGLVTFPGQDDAPAAQPLRPLFDYLVRNPLSMTLSDDNYALRMTYARITGHRPVGTVLLRRSRSRLQQDLAAAQSRIPPTSSKLRMKRSRHSGANRQAGFSLITMSILLTVASLIFVSFLPGKEAGDVNQKQVDSIRKLEKVEEAMRSFMAFNGRRPCPADGSSAINTATFGAEAGAPGACATAPLGPDVGTGHVVGGTIPTRALGLPDEYAFDEWGRRFTYVVDTRATLSSSCTTLMNYPANTGTGGVTIESTNGGTVLASTMYAYISHGPDGYGAFPEQGSTVGGRLNSGSSDVDTQVNAGVDHPGAGGTFTYNTTNFTNVKVQKSRVLSTSGDTGFDDLVWLRPDLENTCCLGAKCAGVSNFRINGAITNGYLGIAVAHGDINGDGIQDLVISAPGTGRVYVLFGTAAGFSNPFSVTSLNGTNGFYLTDSGDSGIGHPLAVGDINNDGYDDIVACDGVTGDGGGCDVFYGHPAPFPASYDMKNSHTCQNSWFTDSGGGGTRISSVLIADINGDHLNDLIVADWNMPVAAGPDANHGQIYILFGKANSATCAHSPQIDPIPSVNFSDIDTNASTVITGPDGSAAQYAFGAVSGGLSSVAAGDINGDGINDLIIGDYYYQNAVTNYNGRIYVIAGKSSWSATMNLRTMPLTGLPQNCVGDACGFIIENPSCGEGLGNGISVGDVNGDGYLDILSGNFSNSSCTDSWLIKGQAPTFSWAADYNIDNTTSGHTNMLASGMAVDFNATTCCGDFIGENGSVELADVNHDGYMDVILAAPDHSANGNVYVLFGSSTFFNTSTWNFHTTDPNGTNGIRIDCSYADSNRCGEYLGALDLNNDGKTDLVIGVWQGNVTGTHQEGYAYVLYGKTSGWTTPYSLSTIY